MTDAIRSANTMDMPFIEFPKIARFSREVIVTEKIDGSNGCVRVMERQGHILTEAEEALRVASVLHRGGRFDIWAGSRTRWITPAADNFGFAAWVRDHADSLVELNDGTHFGEWWGSGIQRRYGLTEKRWSLFNVSRWTEKRPECCHVVPVLWSGIGFDGVELGLHYLRENGSLAAPGFMDPEGIVAYHVAGNLSFKKTLKKDEEWKGKAR